jgi:murein L,D-transpeptidase YafK
MSTPDMPAFAVSLILLSSHLLPQLPRIAFRVFKAERQMEIWGGESDSGKFHLIATYPVAAISGELGPKRKEGDMQAPEGFYYINRFNPYSQFHLSLGLNYPNSSDRKLSKSNRLGADIFIHGNHVSAGCFAMTDPVIDVIYSLATHARDSGQKHIPVSVFPCRLTPKNWASLRREYGNRPDLIHFWSTFLPAYDSFERTHKWPRPHVSGSGDYIWPDYHAAR